MNGVESFRRAMADAGLRFGGSILADGGRHLFTAEGDHKPNSWYILRPGPPLVGVFGCWKRGFKQEWCERDRSWTRAEAERAEAARRKVEEQLAKSEETARRRAESILQRSQPASPGHPYLRTKKVQPAGELREWDDRLVVPLRDASGVLRSLQFIAADGSKRFLRGGKVQACWFTIPGQVQNADLVVCEGLATGFSIAQATGAEVWCAMGAGNLLSVCRTARAKFPDREIVVAADNDCWTQGNPGMTKAREAAIAIGAKLAVPKFKDVSTRPTDFNDLSQLEGLDAVREQVDAATVPVESEEEMIRKAASLPPVQYDKERQKIANRLGVRVSTLDAEVQKLRPKSDGRDIALQGRAVKLHEAEPWPDRVEGAQVLDSVAKTVASYVALSPSAADAVALWVAHAHCFDVFEHTPRLHVTSPEKRCGKTTLRDVLSCLVPRPLPTENMTKAVLFRLVEAYKPTVLADEFDGWLRENVELVSLFNSGHKRTGQAYRCEGEDNTVRTFSVFAPAVLCGIGSLPGTLADRSIRIRLERAVKGEVKRRFDSRRVEELEEHNSKLARWCQDNREKLAACEPELPEAAFNRLADNWRPLFAIAEIAGGNWPQRVLAAFHALTSEEDETGVGEQLLADIWDAFETKGIDRISSSELVEFLTGLEHRPWAEWKHGKPITAAGLAKLLGRFGIAPRTIRMPDGSTPKGYLHGDFNHVFDRYLRPDPADSGFQKRHTATNVDVAMSYNKNKAPQLDSCGGSEIDVKPCHSNKCGGVAASKAGKQVQSIETGAKSPLGAVSQETSEADCKKQPLMKL